MNNDPLRHPDELENIPMEPFKTPYATDWDDAGFNFGRSTRNTGPMLIAIVLVLLLGKCVC